MDVWNRTFVLIKTIKTVDGFMTDNQSKNTDQVSLEPKSTLVSRNITVSGKRTSVRLEPAMWSALRDISRRERCTIHDLCSLIALRKKEKKSLTAAIRVFLMLYFRASSTEDGHMDAGHGDFEKMIQRAKMPIKIQRKPVPEVEVYSPRHRQIFNPNVTKTTIRDTESIAYS
jgi:predicted DNA-binding ribbon-helix-helix protein